MQTRRNGPAQPSRVRPIGNSSPSPEITTLFTGLVSPTNHRVVTRGGPNYIDSLGATNPKRFGEKIW